MRVRALFLAAAAALLIGAAPASALTFNVDTKVDDPAANCQTTTSCSIRGALVEALRSNGPDVINVPAGDYVLNAQANGQLAVNSDVSIIGASAATTTIRSDGKNARVFGITGPGPAAISHVRITAGSVLSLPTVTDRIGGDILVDAGATLTLDHARVDGGQATRGGGIAIRGGTARIAKSVVDSNQSVFQAGNVPTADAAGILNLGLPPGAASGRPATLTLTDSTVAFNTTASAAGIESIGYTANAVTITRSTVAYNQGTANGGNGLGNAAGTFTVSGSIVASNHGAGPDDNCSAGITSGGGNAETGTTCGFAQATDRQSVANGSNQLVAGALSPAGETPVLAIRATSVAVDLAGSCTGADQREFPRPQGAGCDAGAYEVDLTPPDASIVSGPSGTTTGSTAAFTFSSSVAGVTFECRLDGPSGAGAFGPCASPAIFTGLAPGSYTFFLRATDPSGNQTTTSRSFSVAAVPPPPAVPVAGKSVVIQPVSGKTLVKLPGSKTFVPVDVTRGIPFGSIVDTRHSRIRLYAIPKAGKPAESALFYDGIFKVTAVGAITQLTLVETLAPCPAGKTAAAAAKKPKTRKLWGDGSGSFRTRGQYSAATVRGTKWLVQDSCGKTLTRVARGVVSVQDFVKKKTLLVRAPKSYTARKRG